MPGISAVLITLNESKVIEPTLQALSKVVDEILVLDSFSTDDTPDICRKYGAKVVQEKWQGFAATKNRANQLATHDWILSIDADEVLSDQLIATLQQLSPSEGHVYALDRITNYCGSWIKYCGWYPDWKVRLFKKQDLKWGGGKVHEVLLIPPSFTTVKLKGKLYHYSYNSPEDHLQRIERYAGLAAEDLHQQGKRVSLLKQWLAPPARFIKTYIFKRGFLDGKNGWTISRRDAQLVKLKYQKLKALNQGSL